MFRAIKIHIAMHSNKANVVILAQKKIGVQRKFSITCIVKKRTPIEKCHPVLLKYTINEAAIIM